MLHELREIKYGALGECFDLSTVLDIDILEREVLQRIFVAAFHSKKVATRHADILEPDVVAL